VVEKGGYGTSVTPVSQFYFQQAFNNVMFGPWTKIAEGYGKMVLGYFGRTPVAPNAKIVALASKQLKLEPTKKNALDLADADDSKSLLHVKELLEKEGLKTTEENLFIAASCKEKGIAFLKGEAKANVRKIGKADKEKVLCNASEDYTVIVNGQKYNVKSSDKQDAFVINGQEYFIEIEEGCSEDNSNAALIPANGSEVRAGVPGTIFKVLVNVGDKVTKGQPVIIIEAMKMEIEVAASVDGVVSSVRVNVGDTIVNNQLLVTL